MCCFWNTDSVRDDGIGSKPPPVWLGSSLRWAADVLSCLGPGMDVGESVGAGDNLPDGNTVASSGNSL